MKKIIGCLFFLFFIQYVKAQESFTIKHYNIDLKVNKDASLDFIETIDAHFTQSRHGIIRSIQFKYPMQKLREGIDQAERQLSGKNYTKIIVENIQVAGFESSVENNGDFKNIKIGSANKYVDGDQQYVIKYRVLNAINFFKDHSELYFNLIGNQWATSIDSFDFRIELPEALQSKPVYFVATGLMGSKDNNSISNWSENKIFSGHSNASLQAYEGLTVGINFPQNYLIQQNYTFRNMGWLFIPLLVFVIMYMVWKKWGKDDKITVQTEFYPPENISPGVSGYIIDDKLDQRDLTALVPYWGAGGYLRVNELQKSSLLGLLKSEDYEFIKLKDLPDESPEFEKTFFNGIFKTGDNVALSELKNVLYTTMAKARLQLESEIKKEDYYVIYSRGMGCIFFFLGFAMVALGIFTIVGDIDEKLWKGVAFILSGIILVAFGIPMTKKTKKGNELYQKLLGFKEFIKSVEKDRLKEFLTQDKNYFDKILPYAIVFDMADKWKDKLKGLDIPPPTWYSGNYGGGNFNTAIFMNSLNHSMNQMSQNFNSSPQSSGSSGGSFGGGGSSGGGFGGGGGSSW
ncbi:MAG: DUF2207 domain-containing protein [Ginsengibacter sp.]